MSSGDYDNDQKVNNIRDYWEFREYLSYSMLSHDPKDRHYPSDDFFRTLR